MDGMRNIARVCLVDVPSCCDRLYDYTIPGELLGIIVPGSFVVVPFGGGNRSQTALVLDVTDRSEVELSRLKPIITTADELLTLDAEFIGRRDGEGSLARGLIGFMTDSTFCTPGEAVRTILPAPVMGKVREDYVAVAPPSDGKLMPLYDAIRRKKLPTTYNRADLRQLVDEGCVEKTVTYTEAGRKTVEYVRLNIPRERVPDYIDGEMKLRGDKARQVLRLVANADEVTLDELKFELKSDSVRPQVSRLAAQGLVRVEVREERRDPYADIEISPTAENILTDEQLDAARQLTELYESNSPQAALLYGVTGSGKTRVIKHMIDVVTQSGRGVIVLVPEIGLTPQTVSFFKSYYGSRVVVTHSGLSDGERFDAWRMLKSGEADICIGTRSAIFAPVRNLGMIVIDEEQEHTYKSDSSPRYHARDIARFRCAYNNALMLLASATPSLESIVKSGFVDTAESAAKNRAVYHLVTLKNRYAGSLPTSIIADTRPDARNGIVGAIGSRLRAEIADNLDKGEQSILFLNRRGYNMFLSCPSCGEVMTCPDCSVSLTYHTSGINRGLLCCHYCGHREAPPTVCPSCGGTLSYRGYGTQKVEEELHELFPTARILRMDADTTAAKFSTDVLIDKFRSGEADILIGTQMVAKGHDFPRVTLVGVISADMSLYLDDYRANETTFSLLTQVIGRAGRAGTRGRAVIQTFSPDHPVIALAASQDYDSFAKNEAAFRRAFVFPPYCELVAVTYSSENEVAVMAAAVDGVNVMRSAVPEVQGGVYVFGPIEAPLYKLNGRYRLRIIVKCRLDRRMRSLIASLVKPTADVSISVDVNPSSM